MKEKVKKNIEQLLQINLEINSFLKSSNIDSNKSDDFFSNFNTEFEKLLDAKNSFMDNLKNLKNLSEQEFSSLKNSVFKETWQKIQGLENENFNIIKNNQKDIAKKLTTLKTHSKTISSYKFNKEIEPRLFDDSL